jgi:SAM-dependent methyltransferase
MSVARACPLCGAEPAEAYLEKNGLRLVRCAKCTMIYANPIPNEMASGSYYDAAGRDYYLSPAKLESDYAPVRFERELALFRKHCRQGTVLDVGCSSGAFLFQLKQRFPGQYQVLGTDVSDAPLDYAESRGVPVSRGDFLQQDFAGQPFDAITFWAVLEHLAEPAGFLNKASALLKSGGLCFVLVPNMGSLAVRALRKRYRYIYPQHLNYFTWGTLRKLVEPNYEVVECRATHFNPVVLWQDWRSQGQIVSNQQRAELLQRTTAYKQNPLLKPVKVGYRLVEWGLGKLNLADNLAMVLRKKN